MADDTTPTGAPDAQPDNTPTPQPTPGPQAPKNDLPDWVKDPTRAYEEIQKLRSEAATKRNEAKAAQDELEKTRTAEQQRKDKEMKEQQRWQELAEQREKEMAELKAKLEAQTLDTLRVRIGAEYKLPAALVARLQGATEDAIRADAQSLVEELGLDKQPPADSTPNDPADNAPPARGQNTAAVPDGQPAGLTDAERRAKRRRMDSPLFSTEGGVTVTSKRRTIN